MDNKQTVLLGMPRAGFARTFRPTGQEELWRAFEVLEPGEKPTTEDLLALAAGRDLCAVLTTWGAPAFPVAFWEAHPECRFFGHLAGTVRHFFPDDTPQWLLDHGVTVISGQYGLGINVAEMTVGLMITLSRGFATLWRATRDEGAWRVPEVATDPQGLLGATVGLVGASAVGKLVIELLKPFRCRVRVYDPYLDEAAAAALGVERASLEQVLAESDIVSLHHPQTLETDRLLGSAQLTLIRDGALLINTARPRVFDPEALLAAARENRFQIALDVTEPEPLPADHPLRACPNVWITPHVAGGGRYGALMVGDLVMESLRQHLAGEPVRWRYPLERLDQMA
jgi:phosphoglycerate dehydrogenase-like enzyme